MSDLRQRLLLTAAAGLVVFLLAAFAAYVLAEREHAAISRPISALAHFARAFGSNPNIEPPAIRTAPDELGDLVKSVGEMSTRVRTANEAVNAATRSSRARMRRSGWRTRSDGGSRPNGSRHSSVNARRPV